MSRGRHPRQFVPSPEHDLADHLVVLELSAQHDGTGLDASKEAESRRRMESWEFLLSRGIHAAAGTDFDGPATAVRTALVRYRLSAAAIVFRIHAFLQSVRTAQRFVRRALERKRRRILEIVEHWTGKEGPVRDAMRARVQRYQRAHPFHRVVTANAPLWRDYLQCRVPRSLKVKAVEGVMALRKRAWHEEWTAYRLMQARVRGFVDQERLVLAQNNFQTTPELEQLRAQRRLLQQLPEPGLSYEVTSFPLVDLLSRALEIEDEELRTKGHHYYLPGESGEPYPTVLVADVSARDDERPDPGAGAKRSARGALQVDWRRPSYDSRIPHAVGPTQRRLLALQTPHIGEGLSKTFPRLSRADMYPYRTRTPKRLPYGPADSRGSAVGVKLLAVGPGLRGELNGRVQPGGPNGSKPTSRKSDRPSRALRAVGVRGRVEFNDTVQLFSIGILSSDKESSLPRAASAASSCRGETPPIRMQLPSPPIEAHAHWSTPAFRPLQHPTMEAEARLTPRLSCSPSSPKYCPPGACSLPAVSRRLSAGPTPQMAIQRHGSIDPSDRGQEIANRTQRRASRLSIQEQPEKVEESDTEKTFLTLWRPDSRAASPPTPFGGVLGGWAAQSGVLIQPPSRQRRFSRAVDPLGPSRASSLLAEVAASQAALLKELQSDPLVASYSKTV